MKLQDIITSKYLYHNCLVDDEYSIAGVAVDSREVNPGDLYIAIPSKKNTHSTQYIQQAIQRGAKAIVLDQACTLDDFSEKERKEISWIKVDNPRREAAMIASRVYRGQPATTVAVTGTNGKSSVAEFTRQIWKMNNHSAISVGTLGVIGDLPSSSIPSCSLTSPDSFTLHQILAAASKQKVDHCVLEASSHGIDQHRLDGVVLKAAAFTNLTHEHLDYHGSMQEYFAAKRKLFLNLLPQGETAVLNSDETHFSALQSVCQKRGIRIISYGEHSDADLQVESHRIDGDAQILSLKVMGKHYKINFPLVGRFQVYNALCALGLHIATSSAFKCDASLLEQLVAVPGRLELVGYHPDGGAVYVDYAHTPGALEAALTAIRPHVRGLLTVVFGCGGDRDQAKRPMMGGIAISHAERVIITDDNPRSESAEGIRAEIKKACMEAIEIGNRGDAIEYAIKNLGRYDSLLIAGKGHEQGQIIGDTVVPFDDRAFARDVLRSIGGQVI